MAYHKILYSNFCPCVKARVVILVGQRSIIGLYSVYHDQYFYGCCVNVILQNLLEIGQEPSTIFSKT